MSAFAEALHPRSKRGTFTEKTSTAPELTLPVEPKLYGDIAQPTRVIGLTDSAYDLFDNPPPGTKLRALDRDWTVAGFARWEDSSTGDPIDSDRLWAEITDASHLSSDLNATMELRDGFTYSDAEGLLRVPQEGGAGENILGDGHITGDEYAGQRVIDDARTRYAKTPVMPEELVHRGEYRHVGDGIWLRRCRECPAYVKSYGSIQYLHEFAKHEADHGLQVPGYNQALLP